MAPFCGVVKCNFMPRIDLRSQDLEIQVIKTGEYTGTEKAQIKWPLATDPSFIEELRLAGVKTYEPKPKNEE